MTFPLRLTGVNFQGYGSSAFQNRFTPIPPKNYVEDSFKIFSDHGLSCIRIPVYWESWEFNKGQFHNDLNEIAATAEKYDLKCIYDNHQWECSSWIGSGIGFPNSLMSRHYERTAHQTSRPDYYLKKDFWNRWWNRTMETVDGTDCWDAQLVYLLDFIELIKDHKSTYGFELLNEPAVFALSHYKRIRIYYDYIIKGLRKITSKPLLFCWAAPHRIIDFPTFQAMASPSASENVIFDCHPYPPSVMHISYFKLITFLIGKNIPIYVGEFNSNMKTGSTLSQSQLSRYFKRLKMMGVLGAAIWRWSYIQDQNIPAFNLAEVRNESIIPLEYFKYFVKAFRITK